MRAVKVSFRASSQDLTAPTPIGKNRNLKNAAPLFLSPPAVPQVRNVSGKQGGVFSRVLRRWYKHVKHGLAVLYESRRLGVL